MPPALPSAALYEAFVIDAYARRIVGWKVSTSATAGFVLDALERAIHARRPGPEDGLYKTEVISRQRSWPNA